MTSSIGGVLVFRFMTTRTSSSHCASERDVGVDAIEWRRRRAVEIATSTSRPNARSSCGKVSAKTDILERPARRVPWRQDWPQKVPSVDQSCLKLDRQ